jgi:hypothetical protein
MSSIVCEGFVLRGWYIRSDIRHKIILYYDMNYPISCDLTDLGYYDIIIVGFELSDNM